MASNSADETLNVESRKRTADSRDVEEQIAKKAKTSDWKDDGRDELCDNRRVSIPNGDCVTTASTSQKVDS